MRRADKHRRAGSAQLLAEADGLQAFLSDACRIGAGILRGDMLQGPLGFVVLAFTVLRKAELQQATSGLVVCGITADEIAKLRLGKLEIAGGVITLTQPIQGIGV